MIRDRFTDLEMQNMTRKSKAIISNKLFVIRGLGELIDKDDKSSAASRHNARVIVRAVDELCEMFGINSGEKKESA